MKFKASVKKLKPKVFVKAANAISNDVNLKVVESIFMIHEEAVKGIQAVSSGKRETRYNPKREVTVSRPGDPPNVDMGSFIKSIQFNVDPDKGTGEVGTNDKRGPMFEFGTKTMKPRPWLTPAVNKVRKQIGKMFKAMKVKVD